MLARRVFIFVIAMLAWLNGACSERKAAANRELLFDLQHRVFLRYEQDGFANLTLAEQTLHCVWWVEAEVNNGGFHQYYWNSSGDEANEAVTALERTGLLKLLTSSDGRTVCSRML